MTRHKMPINNKKELTKDDMRFLIDLNLSNKDYFTKHSNIMLSIAISFTAVAIAMYSTYISLTGNVSFLASLVMVSFLLAVDGFIAYQYVQMRLAVKKYDSQLKYYFDHLYPGLANELR